jgi:hypothetical protein
MRRTMRPNNSGSALTNSGDDAETDGKTGPDLKIVTELREEFDFQITSTNTTNM